MAALAVVLAPLAYFYPATLGRVVLTPDDGVIFNVPLRVAQARTILAGFLPLWNPYIFAGMPMLGASQGGVLFPLNWFFLLFEPKTAANLMMLAAYSLAALGAFLYSRRAGASVAGAALTGLVWPFCGFMVAQVGHTNIVHTAAVLPWVLWALESYVADGARGRGLTLSALVAIQVFAGHQQTLVYSLVLACAYSIFLARTSKGEARRRELTSLALIGAGLLLSSVQLLPTFELMQRSVRSAATYDFFTSFSMPPRFLWALFAPYVVGGGDGHIFRAPYTNVDFYAEYIGYAGLITITLVLLSLVLGRGRRDYFWATVACVALLLALGRFLPLGLYKIVYQIPVINLFRVPARHLLEFDFALAVLAGRGLTALASMRESARVKTLKITCAACAAVFALAWLAVTAGRPTAFRLGRQAPVTFLRAPELFMPLVFAALSAWALWRFARGRRAGIALVFAVLLLDLALWGHASGWRRGPSSDDPLWREPQTLRTLREQPHVAAGEPFRILTVQQPFSTDPTRPANASGANAFIFELQPDIYMMHGVENAAGYDGFGLARQSRMAGDMKVWGELPDPRRSLLSESREFDLLNVRYLVARDSGASLTQTAAPSGDASSSNADTATASTISSETSASDKRAQAIEPLPAPAVFGGSAFAAGDLSAPTLDRGERLVFEVPNVRADRVALVTSLSWSGGVSDKTPVGRITLRTEDGQSVELKLLAGEHTAEWAFDRPDVRASMRHRRATIATSFDVEDAGGRYQGHTYVATLTLPQPAVITGGEIEVSRTPAAPDLGLDVKRISLIEDGRAFPLRSEWIRAAPPRETQSGQAAAADAKPTAVPVLAANERWRRVGRGAGTVVYENARAMPRAWLAHEVFVLSDEDALKTIRTGTLPDGRAWNPLRTAITGDHIELHGANTGATGEARVTRREPNRIDVSASSGAPSVLVLGENFYPGWVAYVDGRKVETMRVNYNLRGVALTPGAHDISFRYRPKSFIAGLLISVLTMCGLAFWMYKAKRQK